MWTRAATACVSPTRGNTTSSPRPRRFGKSLFLDTLKELFEANRPLFDGLYAADNWDWSKAHPVIRISFGAGSLGDREQLGLKIDELLRANARRLGVGIREPTLSGRFRALIEDVAERTGRTVVILIDEYDRMREIRKSGSEGGGAGNPGIPTPIYLWLRCKRSRGASARDRQRQTTPRPTRRWPRRRRPSVFVRVPPLILTSHLRMKGLRSLLTRSCQEL